MKGANSVFPFLSSPVLAFSFLSFPIFYHVIDRFFISPSPVCSRKGFQPGSFASRWVLRVWVIAAMMSVHWGALLAGMSLVSSLNPEDWHPVDFDCLITVCLFSYFGGGLHHCVTSKGRIGRFVAKPLIVFHGNSLIRHN